ncbi:PREDICTED: RUS1 family protein C16orf58 homolog, partial [Nanorana parkeri]|uniref:RUS1 family protein C16orf58 homolog n=1 Tax=Nanorana parkeri TaxID=125878 RepID=UPI0008547CE4
MVGWLDEWKDGWMDGWMDGWLDEWKDGWMDGWLDEWKDGWMDGWLDGSVTYLLFLLLTSLHLYANYRAVRSVVMETLNRSRLSIILEHFLREGRILSPAEANGMEPLLPGLGSQVPLSLGVPLTALVSRYIIIIIVILLTRRRLAVVLHEGAGSVDIVRSVVHAEILHRKSRSSDPTRFHVLEETHAQLDRLFPDFCQ